MPLVYGINAVREALRSEGLSVERVLLAAGSRNRRLGELAGLARSRGIRYDFQPKEALTRRAGTADHQGAVAIISAINYSSYREIIEGMGRKPLILILDGVEDPHNLGAAIRSADAAGVSGIFMPERRTAGVSEVVLKVSAGAAAHVKIARVVNIRDLIRDLKREGLWVVGIEPKASTRWTEVDYNRPLALVFGSEGKGIRRAVRESCDQLAGIPMYGRVESLNLSVAVGIVLYEAVRQRMVSAVLEEDEKGESRLR